MKDVGTSKQIKNTKKLPAGVKNKAVKTSVSKAVKPRVKKKTPVKPVKDNKNSPKKKIPLQIFKRIGLYDKEKDLSFSAITEIFKPFSREFKKSFNWLMITFVIVFTLLVAEQSRLLNYKEPIFNIFRNFFIGLGGIFAAAPAHYLRIIPAIIYQMFIPGILVWFIYLNDFKKGNNSKTVKTLQSAPFFKRIFLSFVNTARENGFYFKPVKRWWKYILLIFLLILPFIAFVAMSKEYKAVFPSLVLLRQTKSFLLFIVYEFILLSHLLSTEFLFRGVFIKTFREKMGYSVIFLQLIPYITIQIAKPSEAVINTVIRGLLLGFAAYETRSIWPGFLIYGSSLFVSDFFALYL